MKILTLALLLYAAPAFAVGGPYSVVSTNVTHPLPGLTRTETVVQDGPAATDRFTMTRVTAAGCDDGARGSFLLLPGQQANFELYEVTVSGDYSQSLAGYLATRGYDVWGYSPRTKGIVAGACTADGCPYMADWGLATVASDASYIRAQIVSTTHKKPVVGGWSIGAISTIAVLNDAPHDYSGAVIWEGMLYSTDAGVLTGNAANCATAQAQYAAAKAGGTTLQTLKSIAFLPPDVAASILLPAVTTPLPAPPGFVPDYTLLAGNADDSALAYSSMPMLLLALQQTFNDYEAQAISVDTFCSLAGDRSFTDNLRKFDKPLLVIRTGHGFGPYMDDNLNLLGTHASKRTTVLHSEFAHGDNYANVNPIPVLHAPVKAFLDSVF